MCKLIPSLVFALVLPFPAIAQELLSDSELSDQRGGLRTPDGIEFAFGAVINTHIDGQPVLQTQVSWTDQGIVRMPITGNSGMVIPGLNGDTVVIHDMDAGRIANLVLNSADNRDIRQDTAITVALPDHVQSELIGQQAALGLQDAVNRAITDATR